MTQTETLTIDISDEIAEKTLRSLRTKRRLMSMPAHPLANAHIGPLEEAAVSARLRISIGVAFSALAHLALASILITTSNSTIQRFNAEQALRRIQGSHSSIILEFQSVATQGTLQKQLTRRLAQKIRARTREKSSANAAAQKLANSPPQAFRKLGLGLSLTAGPSGDHSTPLGEFTRYTSEIRSRLGESIAQTGMNRNRMQIAPNTEARLTVHLTISPKGELEKLMISDSTVGDSLDHLVKNLTERLAPFAEFDPKTMGVEKLELQIPVAFK